MNLIICAVLTLSFGGVFGMPTNESSKKGQIPQSIVSQRTCHHEIQVTRNGTCPVPDPNVVVNCIWCNDNCVSDDDCPGDSKCCWRQGCGNICNLAVFPDENGEQTTTPKYYGSPCKKPLLNGRPTGTCPPSNS